MYLVAGLGLGIPGNAQNRRPSNKGRRGVGREVERAVGKAEPREPRATRSGGVYFESARASPPSKCECESAQASEFGWEARPSPAGHRDYRARRICM